MLAAGARPTRKLASGTEANKAITYEKSAFCHKQAAQQSFQNLLINNNKNLLVNYKSLPFTNQLLIIPDCNGNNTGEGRLLDQWDTGKE